MNIPHNQWFAVRCCCTPQKVFGFLRLLAPNNPLTTHHTTLTDNNGQQHPIKIMPIYSNPNMSSHFGRVLFNMDPVQFLEHTKPELAVYSDDRPLEFWRNIPGFVEAPNADKIEEHKE